LQEIAEPRASASGQAAEWFPPSQEAVLSDFCPESFMGTISNSLTSTPVTTSGSSPSSSSSSNTTGIFTGTSAYSQDFQNLINRAVAIASLPVQLLTNQQTALTSQSTELTTLDTKFAALQTAIQGIGQALSGSSFETEISNPSEVSATLGDGAMEGVYSIQVNSIGAYAASLTAQSWDSAGGTSDNPASYTLVIGTQNYTITPQDDTAAGVASAINSEYGNLVRATAVNVGPADQPDYRISLQSTTLGPMTLDLQVPPNTSLQQQQAANADGDSVSQTAATWDSTPDASGNPSTYSLVVGSDTYSFTPADNNAASVAAAINALPEGLVNATVVDLGTDGNHDYRIQLQSSTPGNQTLDLQRTSAVSLQNQQQPPGELANYEVNGSGVSVTSNTRSVTVAQGVTLNLLEAGDTPVNVTVTRSTSALSSALSAFADAYNAAKTEVDAQRGQSGGALQGQSIVTSLAQTLSNIATYTSSDGSINGLSSLGLSLGTDGKLTFNSLSLMGADLSNSAGVTAFLGSADGGGFLKTATDGLNGIEDPTTGLLKTTEGDTQSQITKLGTTISAKQSQVDALQLQLQDQMAKADAMIAEMEQQYSYLSDMFSAMQTSNQMYAKG
jgi:flagellar hook-associated protein 2